MAMEPGVYEVRFIQNGIVREVGTFGLETTVADESVSGVFNVAKGAAAGLANAFPNAFVALLLRRQEADEVMEDYDTVAALLAGESEEATFTNYARKTGLTATVEVDDAGDAASISIPNQAWLTAGGAVNNSLVKLVIAVQTGADDTTLIPLTHHNFQIITNGSAIATGFNEDGFYRVQ